MRVRGTVDEFTSSGSFLGNTQNSSLTKSVPMQSELVCSTGNSFTRTVVSLPAATAPIGTIRRMAVQINQQLAVTGISASTFDQIDLAPALLYAPTVSADQSRGLRTPA